MFISLCSNLLVKCTQVAGARKAAGLERGVHDADVQDRVAPGKLLHIYLKLSQVVHEMVQLKYI